MRRITVNVTTASGGGATVYTPKFSGVIHSIHYVKDGTTPFADGVDFAITKDSNGEGVWTENDVNANATRYPRAPTNNQTGGAALYASGGVGVLDKIGVANDKVKFVISSGGNTKKGKFHVLIVE